MESFTVRNLNFAYPGQSRKALDGLSFSVSQGEFVTLIGPSGCGKTTLLRQLKPLLAPFGTLSGEILFEGRPLKDIDQREQSARIGFVMQNPDSQIVTDKVWHELAFGLESLGCDTATIRARVAEVASFFGIQGWFYKDVSGLSGGQKQLLNLASVMAMQPSVLILDEPTSQLDPIAATDFLATVGRINRELGITVIMTEHRLEEVLPMSDRVMVMDEGSLIFDGSPREAGEFLKNTGHAMFYAMPAPMQIYAAVEGGGDCPVTVREGRLWLSNFAKSRELKKIPDEAHYTPSGDSSPAVELDDVWFKYEKDHPDVLRGLSMKAYPGEFLAVVGSNGAGKTTMLSVISGLNRPYRGRVILEGRDISRHESLYRGLLGVLPQNPQTLFVKKTVREDLLETLESSSLPKPERERKIASVVRLCRLEELLDRHPYDLSGGEQQRAALAKVLLLDPRILLLDEPTKGLDAEFKRILAAILEKLLKRGVTVIMVSHDIEFCARYAHRCAMFFDGTIISENAPRAFFSGNGFYTTAANRMARHLLPSAVTAEDVIAACGGKIPSLPDPPAGDDDGDFSAALPETSDTPERKLPLWRKIIAGISAAAFLSVAAASLAKADLSFLFGGSPIAVNVFLICALFVLALAVTRRTEDAEENRQIVFGHQKLPKRTAASVLMILLAIPLTIFIGAYYLEDRKYFFISLLIILESMLPFMLVFEGRKPQARELVIVAVLCALGVAGRAAFFALPQLKPVAALVIISGVAFGGETGFLVGAITILVSNIMFGQGPWTPWQMFAMGIIGFLSGLIFRKGFLRPTRLSLSVFGGFSALVIYGGLVNPSMVLAYNSNPTWPMFLAAYAAALPFDVIFALATALFLWIFSGPMLEKLDRIKAKYGLVQPPEEPKAADAAQIN